MFNNQTLIIVGAGASSEANLPDGKKLKKSVADSLNIDLDARGRLTGSDRILCQALDIIVKKEGLGDPRNPPVLRYIRAAQRIRDAMPLVMSIDNFIDMHQGNKELELCGKLAIVRNILEAERSSSLYFEVRNSRSSIDFNLLDNTWFNSFMQLLTENCTVEHLEERLSTIKFVIFNYDRCVEHFLYNALQTSYGIDANRAATLVNGIKIYHPYGTVGELPWSMRKHIIAFGEEPKPDELIELAGQIKTFTEGTNPGSSAIAEIRNGMTEARIVLFLGFAFHRQNLNLIRPPVNVHLKPDEVQYYGTALHKSSHDLSIITSDLVNLGGAQKIYLRNDLTCFKLFSEYWRSLALS